MLCGTLFFPIRVPTTLGSNCLFKQLKYKLQEGRKSSSGYCEATKKIVANYISNQGWHHWIGSPSDKSLKMRVFRDNGRNKLGVLEQKEHHEENEKS